MNNRFDDYINAHPKESLWLVSIGLFLLWQSLAAILGIILYFILVRRMKLPWCVMITIGIIVSAFAILCEQYYFNINFITFIREGFSLNLTFWKQLLTNKVGEAFYFLFSKAFNYVVGFPLFLAGILSTIDLIPGKPHVDTMNALQKGQHTDDILEVDDKEINTALDNLHEENFDGTVLGISKYMGYPVTVADHDVNHIILVLGTTGSGKTITLKRFYRRAITKGYPLIIIDGKPDEDNITWLMRFAKQHNRQFYGFNCGNYLPYDPLTNGGYTELKDKIISLKDEWSSDHYRSIAEDYLQATFQVLLKSDKSFDLKAVVEYLNYEDLAILARSIKDKDLIKRVASLEQYDRKDITGLQAHLNILIYSELGHFFEKNTSTFNLTDAIQQDAVVYFALPALSFPSFSQVLGKLVINDLKAVINRLNSKKSIFTVFDEFSVFAGQQVLNLVNMGRGKGVHAIFGTQGLADLDKVDVTFKNQVLNCANTLICHRLNDQESSEAVANWIGTQNKFTVTAQINTKQDDAGLGTVRRNKEFIVHPDMIKQELQTGEAFYITKMRKFKWDKVRVKFL